MTLANVPAFNLTANYSHATPLLDYLLACHTRIETISNPRSRYLASATLAVFSRNCIAGDASYAGDAGASISTSTSTSLSPTLLSCLPVSTPTVSKSELRKCDRSDSSSLVLALAISYSTKGAS
jgi:hypothetical protein